MPKQILVVDDDEDSLFILSAILTKAGYGVSTAKDGQEALRILCSSRPDLVLLDLILPEMDGFSVSETIKSSASLRAVPVLMISAWTDADSVLEKQSLRAGAEELLTKPINPKTLLSKVRKYLKKNPLPLSAG